MNLDEQLHQWISLVCSFHIFLVVGPFFPAKLHLILKLFSQKVEVQIESRDEVRALPLKKTILFESSESTM